ncbi:MAG: hypothetical protein WA154_01295 [Moraxellaceae bacterium]
MEVDSPKKALYNDFVQLVDKVSTSIVSQPIAPVSTQMKKASEVMQNAANNVDQISESIRKINSKVDSIVVYVDQNNSKVEALFKRHVEVINSSLDGLSTTASRAAKLNEQKNLENQIMLKEMTENQIKIMYLMFANMAGILVLIGILVYLVN